MKRDLLAEIYKGSISLDEADSAFDEVLNSQMAAEVREILGMSEVEYTAYCHGIGLAELAKWRYEGWPKTCARCGKDLDVENYGWFAKRQNGKPIIVHVSCL